MSKRESDSAGRLVTSLVQISCSACAFKTRTTLRWLTTRPYLVCEGCLQSIHIDGVQLTRSWAGIEDALRVVDDVTAELRKPRAEPANLS